MQKIIVVFGTRPEAIKVAPLIKEFQNCPNNFETIVCVTGQHRQMLDQVLNLFEITPDFDLNIMKQNQDLYDITAKILTGMKDVFDSTHPDLVFVHGDTTTSMATALAAFYRKIPVAHIEAGLRTHNIYSPWPEEMNRQITGRIATYNFAPTTLSKENLLKEGINETSILVTGNTVIDALYLVIEKIKNNVNIQRNILNKLLMSNLPTKVANSLVNKSLNKRKIVLITGHRRENFGEGFISICEAIKTLAQKYPNVDFIYPMHLNPNVRKPINKVFGIMRELKNIFFIEPLEYLPFVFMMKQSHVILTDSGGIQEEAPSLGKPVLVMRDTTERPEAIAAGTVKLVGTNYNLIISEMSKLLENSDYYNTMSKANNPYGDGNACKRIINLLENK